MKFKLISLALLFSMCSNIAQESSEEIRVISLSTTHTEVIQTLGGQDTLVAIDAFSEVDFQVERIDAYTVTAEELLPLKPDVVVVAFDFNGIIDGLEEQNINYILLPPATTFEDVYSQIETIGDIVNKRSEAAKKVRDMKIEINRTLDNSNYKNISVYHEIGYTYGIYSVNSDSLIGEIYNSLGIENIANLEEDPYGSGYPALSEEMVIEANPDFIVVGHSDYLNKDLSIRDGWGNLTAVQESNVYFLDDTLASNWGTNTVELVQLLSEVFEESAQTNVYSDYLLLLSLLALVLVLFVSTRQITKEKI
tara:strand:- start:420 stop:1343 length:924 start_codon:yes stop_codon:yes gene_type:complete